jgi:cytochrome c oxidase subunit 4
MSKQSKSEPSKSEHSGAEHAKSSLTTYFAIWIALLVGTALTVYASGVNLGRFNAAVALTIATIKATLVALFFMHIKGASEKLTKLVVIAALFFLLLLLGLTMSDFATRPWS